MSDLNLSRDLFVEKRHDLERIAREVEGNVGRNEGDWGTDSDACMLRPYTAMVRIASYLSMYGGLSTASYAAFILECTKEPDESLDEIYSAGKQEKFLDLFQHLKTLYDRTSFQG